jgi:hypothetical protein
MRLHDYFADFLTNTVNLSQTRLDTLEARVAAVEKALLADSQLGSALGELIPQGSFAHRTIINPVSDHEYDADVLLPFELQDGWEPKDYVPELYKLFNRTSTYNGKAHRRSRCVYIDYSDPFHVDMVPYVERHGSTFITNRATNEWELTHPEGFNEWLDEQNRLANGHLIAVIRLMKYLRDYKQTFSVKSVVLTTLLGGAVKEARIWGDTTYCCDLPTALVQIVGDLDDYLQANEVMPTIADPSCPTENFNHRWNDDEYKNFRTRLNNYAKTMRDALDEADKDTSLKLWRGVFGDDFKKAPVVSKTLEASRTYDDPEQDIERDYHFTIEPRYRIKLIGRVEKRDGFRHYALPTKMNQVGKDRWIEFTVEGCAVPPPYKVYWKVRNSGAEAIAANQLRGQIVEGSLTHREHTLYKGSHYVEVYIVKDGRCVARDMQRVVIR